MADDNDTTTIDTAAVGDADPEAAFGSGFAGATDKTETKPPANGKAEPAQDAAKEEAEPPPEVVQITKKEWDEIKTAASRTASYEKQFSNLHGNYGKVRELINDLQAKVAPKTPPAERKVEVSKAAFAEMEKDFPELAQQTRAALEAALSGLPSTNGAEVDATKIQEMWASYNAKHQLEVLEDAYPDWRDITGAVTRDETPDPNHPFRKWLASKDEAYQNRIAGSESAAVVSRAIRLFQRETATPTAPAKPNGAARDTARAAIIRNAVQPRGDNAGSAPQNSAEEAFASGFGH